MVNYLGIIPARGGSKGVPQKNIRMVGGKPLISWSIEQALACELINGVIVSTDDEEIAEIAKRTGAEVPFIRPKDLALDSTPTEPVLIHVVEEIKKGGGDIPDAIVLLQPTSPIRKKGRLSEAIRLFEKENADSLLSVVETHPWLWKNKGKPKCFYDYNNRPTRQNIRKEDILYRENGSIYITRTPLLMEHSNRLAGHIVMFEMDHDEGQDIDTLTDMMVADQILRQENKV